MLHVLIRSTALSVIVAALSTGTALPQPPSAVPKGEVTKYTFDQSQIFPGTVRDYWVYVPRQYGPAKPACVHVNQDGVQYNAPAVFDELIHQREMPVVIGVFVMHGRVKALADALRPYSRTVTVRGGMLGDRAIDAGQLTRLATLPSREVLLGKAAGGMAAPIAGMAGVLAANLRNLVGVLSAVADKKQQTESAA